MHKRETMKLARKAVRDNWRPADLWSRKNRYRPTKGAPRDWMYRLRPTTETVQAHASVLASMSRDGWIYEGMLVFENRKVRTLTTTEAKTYEPKDYT